MSAVVGPVFPLAGDYTTGAKIMGFSPVDLHFIGLPRIALSP